MGSEILFPFQWITEQARGSTYILTHWLFFRVLGLIYLIAFLSIWIQITGLLGERGILPIKNYLKGVKRVYGSASYRLIPSVFWINSSNRMLHFICALGVTASVFLILNLYSLPALILLWILYLSITNAGQEFLSFQWDVLLLEVGFLAVLFEPLILAGGGAQASPIMLFLLWWLLFRLMFESGITKLTSGDSTWRDLTALDYHYFSQPLPVWMSWYFHHMPTWFRKFSCFLMFVIELVLPFLIFGAYEFRMAAFVGLLFLQTLIFLTGNYNFFNLLSVVICIPLLDDRMWSTLLPESLTTHVTPQVSSFAETLIPLQALFAVLAVVVGLAQIYRSVFPYRSGLTLLTRLEIFLSPLRILNAYGLFRVMTTSRPEIIIQGSRDGETWKEYEFKYKVGNPHKRPKYIEPHQPRLDWQMWFAALSSYQANPWFQSFLLKLLEGEKDVLSLIAVNPFEDNPPQFIRAQVYDYKFSTPEQKKSLKTWWTRKLIRPYSPVLSLR